MDKMEIASVDDYLNAVNYEDIDNYIPTEFALEFTNFIKLVNGAEGTENKTPPVHFKLFDSFVDKEDVINLCHRGFAKLGAPYSKILTPSGWTTMEDIKEGDSIISRYGVPEKVCYKTPYQNPDMYRIHLSDGSSFDVGDEHLHIVWMYRSPKREKVLTTKQLLEKSLYIPCKRKDVRSPKKSWRYAIPLCEPIQHPTIVLPIEPYTMGYGIANGSYLKSHISTHSDDADEIKQYIEDEGYSFLSERQTSDNGTQLKLKGHLFKPYVGTDSRNKRIPQEYLFGSIEQRTELLRGLMDGDGTIAKNGASRYDTFSKGLAEDVVSLVRSLGGIAYYKTYPRDYGKGEVVDTYKVTVNIKINPFKLKRKAGRWKPTKKASRAIVDIEPIEKTGGYCIMVDSEDHSYITDNYTVTHNSTLKEYLILYIGVYGRLPDFGKVPFAIYVSDSIDNGVKKMRKSLEYRWHNSEFLQKYITKISFTDIRWEFISASGTSFVVAAYGSKTGVRGTRENNSRPVLALLDDLISDEDAKSPTVIANVEDTVTKAIEYALHPTRRKVIWSGTPFNQKDPLYKAVESGVWKVNAYPVCETFPCEESEFRGSWEDRFDYKYVKRMYDKAAAQGKLQSFNQELMLRVMSDDDRIILDDDIGWFMHEAVTRNKANYNFYITTDFATSEKTTGDFSVIAVWAYTNNGDWLLVDGVCNRQLMDQNINDLFRLVQIYRPQSVGVEVTGQQGGFIQWIKNEMAERNNYFNLASDTNGGKEGIRPSTNKFTRFMTVVPLFKAKKVLLPLELKSTPLVREMVSELSYITNDGIKSKKDDCIDVISMLSLMNPWKPATDMEVKQDKSGVWILDDDDDDYDSGYSSYIV